MDNFDGLFDVSLRLVAVMAITAFGWTACVRGDEVLQDLSTCIFFDHTRIPCPLCGVVRSQLSLFCGNVLQSILYHPLGVSLLVLAGSLVVWGRHAIPGLGVVELRTLEAKNSVSISNLGSATLAAMLLLAGSWLVRLLLVPESFW